MPYIRDGREERCIKNNWCKVTETRRLQGKAFMKPRRRKALKGWKERGPKNRPRQIFSRAEEYVSDMYLAVKVLRMNNYDIPQDLFDKIVATGKKLMDDPDAEIQLKSTELMRKVVKDAAEREMMQAEMDAIKEGDKPQELHVTLSEDFFGNDAHERIEGKDAKTQPEGEGGTDNAAPTP